MHAVTPIPVVVSVDLAMRRYRDIGIAVLSGRPDGAEVQFVQPVALGLSGAPQASDLAYALASAAERFRASLILLDGPQGWRASDSTDPYMRSCERATHTPGKTGLPGCVKPSSWTRMVYFSIAVFDEFATLGWPRFDVSWNGDRRAIESFPTHAWRTMGWPPLPGKANRKGDPSSWFRWLRECGMRYDTEPNHDEAQAAIAGLAGLMLLDQGVHACDIAGTAPFVDDGSWREGFIVSPKWDRPR